MTICAFGLISCGDVNHNVLTEQEKAEGWELLFDGETLNGWRDYNGTALTGPWEVVDGTIQADGQGSDASGYIVTDNHMRILSFLGIGKYLKEEIVDCFIML